METWKIGDRVKVEGGELGYIYSLERDMAAIVLDVHAHRNNAPIYWARLDELERV